MGSPKHGTSGSSREGLALVGQNTAIILLCADATKTQSYSGGGGGGGGGGGIQ